MMYGNVPPGYASWLSRVFDPPTVEQMLDGRHFEDEPRKMAAAIVLAYRAGDVERATALTWEAVRRPADEVTELVEVLSMYLTGALCSRTDDIDGHLRHLITGH